MAILVQKALPCLRGLIAGLPSRSAMFNHKPADLYADWRWKDKTLEMLVVEKVAPGEVYVGKSGTRRGLLWKEWH